MVRRGGSETKLKVKGGDFLEQVGQDRLDHFVRGGHVDRTETQIEWMEGYYLGLVKIKQMKNMKYFNV